METYRDEDRLIAELRALRPLPGPEFAAQLDERAAAGFPRRRGASAGSRPARLLAWLRSLSPRQLWVPAGGIAVAAALAVATVVVVNGPGGGGSAASPDGASGIAEDGGLLSELNRFHDGVAPAPQARSTAMKAGPQEVEAATAPSATQPLTAGSRHREVERSAEVVLAAAPADVADDAAAVFEAVHANRGIVLRSSTREGEAGEAGASFELLIPSGRLADALAAFSAIDEVRSRHEATADITAPTVGAAELLKEARARIDSLLAQLEGAETEAEREAVEAELRHERRHAGRLAAQLTHLHRRADLSRVSVQIVTGGPDPTASGGWGVEDALHDAGRILAVAAAVALVALAIIGPIALLALLAWLSHRAWVRRERRRALG